MGGAPVVETIRPGVQFTPDAAASFRRAESGWGRTIRANSTYRDYWHQMSMYNNWNAYVAGRGPHPGHSRAIHPDYSIHCRGEALDSPDLVVSGFIAHMARHGWVRTAANDPTEQHHFEYQSWRDRHRNDPAPAGGETITKEWDEMATQAELEAAFRRVLNETGASAPQLNQNMAFLASQANGWVATDRPAEGQLATAISRITELLFAVDGRADPRVKDAKGEPVTRALAVFLQHPEAFVSALADAVAARLAQDAE